MKEYGYKSKNIKFRNRLITLITAGVLGVIGGVVLNKPKNKNEIFEETRNIEYTSIDNDYEIMSNNMEVNFSKEEPSIKEESPTQFEVSQVSGGDSLVATDDVNLRLDNNIDSFKIGYIPKGTVVDRIMSFGDWDLIRNGDVIAYVSSDYTKSNEVDYNNEYYYTDEYNDIVTTTSVLNFRTGPSTSETSLFKLDKDEEVVVIGKAIPFNNEDDVWYIARARGKIGFISAKYTNSFKNIIKNMDPSINDVEIKSLGYITDDTSLYDQYGNSNCIINQYQLVEVLFEYPDRYLVNYEGKLGFINKNKVQFISGTFVAVDLSSQRVYYYVDDDLAYFNKCTTGADKTPTNEGYFKVYERTNSRYFSESAQARYMWANFDHGNGFHDAPWESPSKFGDTKYRKKNGSKGCVRLPDEAAKFFKKQIKVGTKVLVKK